jgi:hypothetical protein
MFCPKCGLQNADESKFCRGCGTVLSNVLAILDGKPQPGRELTEKHIGVFSSGLRGVIIGAGFLLVAILGFILASRSYALPLFAMALGFYFLGTGISRLSQARALKALNQPGSGERLSELPPVQTEFIKPLRSIYETDDLLGRPLSVTEHTTTHLQMDTDEEPFSLPKR